VYGLLWSPVEPRGQSALGPPRDRPGIRYALDL